MPVAEWMSSSAQPREVKQYLKDLSQNLSGLALSALKTPFFALAPPSLLTALWELWQMALSGAAVAALALPSAARDAEGGSAQVPPQQARVGDAGSFTCPR